MDIRKVTDQLSVSGQILPEDVEVIAAAGYRAIICNRPDGEAADQADFGAIEAAAKAEGLEIVWQPVISGRVQDSDGERFGEIVNGLPGPVLAYCRTGTRCITLWSLSQAPSRPVDEIIAAAARAGYDLRPLAPKLEDLKARSR